MGTATNRSMKYVALSASVKRHVAFGLAFASLLVTLAACGDSFVEPSGGRPPSPPPSPPPPPPIAPSGNPTYVRVSPSFIPGTQYYVFHDDTTFGLQYAQLNSSFEYRGSYARTESVISLRFHANGGTWTATGAVRGDSLIVEYSERMLLDDFEDGVYVLVPTSDSAPPPSTPDSSGSGEQIYLASADGLVIVPFVVGSSPAWSPDGRRIAFEREGDVRVINVDGSNEIRLTNGSHPAWSPDGTRIAFTSAEGISVMNVDGSAVRTAMRHDFRDDTYKPWDMGVGHPTWSPDGARIAFLHLGDGDVMPAQAFVMSSDGSNRYLLTRFPDRKYAESFPSWSPDGSKILYWSYGYGIAMINSEGGLPTTIYSDFPEVNYWSRPVWSPDGNRIAFNKGMPPVSGSGIWIISATGSVPRLLISNGYDAAWSPDGGTIAFVRAVD